MRINSQEDELTSPGRSKRHSKDLSASNSKAVSQINSKAPSRSLSPLLDGSQAAVEKTGMSQVVPEGESALPMASPSTASKRSDASREKKEHEHTATYSGKVRVRCSWIRFPEIWEWKACASAERHFGEVSGLAFSWGDWGAGSGSGREAGLEAPDMVITSCSLGGDIRTWKWAWSMAAATDAEGNIMCSIYDRQLIAQEKERAKREGKEYQGPGSESAPSSRPGTSSSSQMFSRKSSVSRDVRTPSSARPGSKESARQHQGGKDSARPGSKDATRTGRM